MPTTSSTRGQCVARRRIALGLTQEGLAIRCGCSPRTIQRIERDQYPSMKQRLIEALHEHLLMPFGEIVNGKRAARRP